MTVYRRPVLRFLLMAFLLYPPPAVTKADEEREEAPARKAINRRIDELNPNFSR